jgi:hypothetical protein
MDNREAEVVLRGHLDGYRQRAYSELVRLRGKAQTAQLQGASGTSYQVEVEIHWDAKPGGAVRVLGSIDDGGVRSLRPISQDFILSPDGTFLGE